MARRTTWLIDMGDGTWAVCCMACRIALYRGPKAGADRAARGHSCEPVLPLGRAPAGLNTRPCSGPGAAARPRTHPWTDAPPTANPTNPREGAAREPSHRLGPAARRLGPAAVPGWAPLVDHGPLPLRAASSVARWWWPTLAVGGFLAVVVQVLGHDDPAPGLSHRGLVTVALAAAVVVLLTIHRRNGPGPLARAVTEYTVVALLATLLAAAAAPGSISQAEPAAAKTKPNAEAAADDDQPAVLQAGATGRPGRDRSGQGRGRRRPLAGRPVAPSRPAGQAPKARRWPPRPALLPRLSSRPGGAHDQVPPPPRRRPPHHRAVAVGVFAIAVVACATSYNAIYRLVGQLGLYGYRINQAFPLMLDAAFLVAELAAILGGIMRAVTRSDEVSAGWPGATMLLCGAGDHRLQRRPRLSDRRPR